MIDPVFTTRAELVAWAKQRLLSALPASPASTMTTVFALEHIKRVTLAHAHLEYD